MAASRAYRRLGGMHRQFKLVKILTVDRTKIQNLTLYKLWGALNEGIENAII